LALLSKFRQSRREASNKPESSLRSLHTIQRAALLPSVTETPWCGLMEWVKLLVFELHVKQIGVDVTDIRAMGQAIPIDTKNISLWHHLKRSL